ncbi:hypothetical protein GF402_11180 [Candidatus Fermentibacteria bacterium]|nr:hypothetical protein [Candidatus Fermentibacteria bacterium]
MQAFLLLSILLTSNPQPELVAVRVEEGPSIDGLLDDPAWQRAQTVHCTLLQYSPDYGMPMTEPTEISILYDEKHIYFGFQMDDPDPATMMEGLTPRDNYVTGEWIAVLLDTWGDGREATSFEISLANSQMDSKVTPYGHWDYSWDSVWESGTHANEQGWSAEFAIPFSCLRFDQTHESQVWTVNFQRILGKTRENGWFILSEARQMAQLEAFAPINGIHGIRGSLGAEIRPYGASSFYHSEDPDDWDSDLDAGLDVKLGITSGVAADLALNPDFGQVEADEAEMNLSHFELFLDERRPFFLESQSLFEMPFEMFYSRRIGAVAPNGEVIPILGGAKISGSSGNGLRFGFLDAVTTRITEDTLTVTPAANYGVFRAVKEFGPYDYVGLSATSREVWEQGDFDCGYDRAFALDGTLLVPGNHVVDGAAARSYLDGNVNDGAYRVGLCKVRSTFTYNAGVQYVGENFDVNGTGYTTVTGYWESWAGLHRTVMPEETFSQINYGLQGHYSELIDGEPRVRNLHANANLTLKSGAYFGADLNYAAKSFDPYEGPEGHTYGDRPSFHIHAGTNHFNDYYITGGAGGGVFDDEGSFQNYDVTLRAKPAQALELRLSGNWFSTKDTENYNWEVGEWDNRRTNWKSLILKAGYMFTPRVNLRLFSQYSRFAMDYSLSEESESSEITANLLYSWQYMPGSMFYLLVENLFQEKEDGGFENPDVGLYGKLTWYLPV